LADDLVAGSERDEMGEALERDRRTIAHVFLDRLAERQKRGQRFPPVAQRLKNGVSPSPWRTMSNWYAVVSAWCLGCGTSAARRSLGTRARIGSCGVVGSSAKYRRVIAWLSMPRAKTVTRMCRACGCPSGPGTVRA